MTVYDDPLYDDDARTNPGSRGPRVSLGLAAFVLLVLIAGGVGLCNLIDYVEALPLP